jgi:hypothetical protein
MAMYKELGCALSTICSIKINPFGAKQPANRLFGCAAKRAPFYAAILPNAVALGAV